MIRIFGMSRRGVSSVGVAALWVVASALSCTGAATAQSKAAENQSPQPELPVANPGRPTVSTPATLTPVGYVQFETGVMPAWHSAEFSTQTSFNEVAKYTATQRLELLVAAGPYAHSDTDPTNGTGDVSLGFQGVVKQGHGASPTLAVGYFGRVHAGDTPDIDIGSASHSIDLLASADVLGFHYDTNYLFNEVQSGQGARRAQYGQTLSVSHPAGKKFGISAEIWAFTQPFQHGRAVGNLWAVNYNAKSNLVFDLGFNRGLTGTSTRGELLAGFTYMLPVKLHLL